jgi:hypothetical protein
LLACLITISSVTSCKKDCFPSNGKGPAVTVIYSVPAFHSVRLAIDGNVHLTQGNVQKLEISAQQNILDKLSLEVVNGKLVIGFDNNCGSINYQTLEIYITIPEVKEIGISGSGNIVTSNTIQSNNLSFDISGSGNVTAAVQTTSVSSNISGSGNINMSGIASIVKFTVSGSGNLRGYQLETLDADITVSGSGDVETTVENNLNVTVSGSGSVRYKGHPAVNSSISGSGSITHMN